MVTIINLSLAFLLISIGIWLIKIHSITIVREDRTTVRPVEQSLDTAEAQKEVDSNTETFEDVAADIMAYLNGEDDEQWNEKKTTNS